MKKLIVQSIPLFIFIVLVAFFWRGLYLKPRDIPSIQIGNKLPEFSMPTLQSSFDKNEPLVLKSSDLQGQVSILNVWASWCDACKDEQAFLLKLADQGVKIYGLNYKDNTNNAKAWLRDWGNPYVLVGEDVQGSTAIDLGVYGSPESFIIDKNGVIRLRHAGALNKQVWDETFVPILAQLER